MASSHQRLPKSGSAAGSGRRSRPAQELRNARGAQGRLDDGKRRRRRLAHRSFRLGQEHVPALHKFSRDADPRTHHRGGRGSEARSLLATAARFPPISGQLERIRTQLGMVFQSFNLWQHMTVLENVIEAPVHVLKIAEGGGRRAGRSTAAQGWSLREEGPVSGVPVGRPAAAGVDRPRLVHGAQGHAVR